jgi:hypothetical protein
MLNRPHLERYVAAYEKLICMTVHELVAKARDLNVSVTSCVERGEIVQKIVSHHINQRSDWTEICI